jgi:hypothetical protein
MYILNSIAVFSLSSFFLGLNSQDLSLPPIASLEATLSTFTEVERNAKLRAYDELKSSDWTELLPSLGVAYTPTGDPRPAASWSPLQIIDRKDQKRKRRLDRESICLQYEILLTDRLYRLRQLYQDYSIDLRALKTKYATLEIDEKLFEITEEKYQNNMIKPSEYLQAKKGIILNRAEIQSYEQELLKRKNEVLYEAKWN